ncbi:MAG TPA: protein kinase [Candidatus Anoxymicrobiaceae bacterium]|jgi:eukaryotic-like serine/threonine-protein kinase
MNCPECGKEITGKTRFCTGCGAGLPDPGSGKTPDTTVRKPSPEKTPSGAGPGSDIPAAFGRYRVLREVGRGAMGVVYLARDDSIGRNVAIKVLEINDRLPADEKEEMRSRFEREARAAGMLSNPNIVTVFDFGEEQGTPYIAMEYLEGATLTEVAQDAPLSIPQATDIVTQVLSALAYAHGHEIVHRDIKPDNIFLLPDGRVKVGDFGIARVAFSSSMTQAGQVIGTPGYMSPEQVKSEAVGPASDIFCVGVLLYELLTGAPAFASTSPTSVMYKIVHEEPTPPHVVNPGVPPNLEAVIARATAKNPAARYSSARLMEDDIRSGTIPEPSSQPTAHDGTVIRAPHDGTVIRAPHDGTTLRARPAGEAMPAAAMVPGVPGTTQPPKKKRTALWVGIGSAGVLVIAAIVVGVILLVGAISDNGTGGEKGGGKTTGGTTGTQTGTQEPAASDITGYVSNVFASSRMTSQVPGVSYAELNMIDNNPGTGWAEGVSGYGEGQYIDFTFREPVWIKDVKAIPGYKKFSEVDRYLQNGKLAQVILTFDDGSKQTVNFSRAANWASADWQVVPLTPVRTQKVRVTIAATYPGQNSGSGAATDTTVSEFHFEGWTAAVYDEYKKNE